ncbi:MAG: hypothetical protein ACLFUQ_03490 [Candidatus Izemoplasmataceae bacterium]
MGPLRKRHPKALAREAVQGVDDTFDALVAIFLPGSEGGNALAEVLYDDNHSLETSPLPGLRIPPTSTIRAKRTFSILSGMDFNTKTEYTARQKERSG